MSQPTKPRRFQFLGLLISAAISAMTVLLWPGLDAAPSASRPQTADHPRLPVGFQRGVNHAPVPGPGHGYGSDTSARELAELRQLGVTWVAITPFGFQQLATDDRIQFDGESASDSRRGLSVAALVRETQAAHRLGLRVTVKPHIWSRDFWEGREWQGTIRHTSAEAHARWWRDYREFVLLTGQALDGHTAAPNDR